jgi:hypothetical protein
VITDANGKFHTAEHISFVGPLLERDLFRSFDETPPLAKITRVSVARTGHVFDWLRVIDLTFAPSLRANVNCSHNYFNF